MIIKLNKDPFNYKRFLHIIKGQDLKRKDCELVAAQLSDATNVQWNIKTFVSNTCKISTNTINNRNKRKELKGMEVEI
jgi:hypothetical protein